MITNIVSTLFRKPRPFATIEQAGERKCNQTIDILKSKISWENNQVKAFIKELSRIGLSGYLDYRELQKKINNCQNTIIFSLVSKEYLLIGVNWARYIHALGLPNYLLFCGDHESYEFFSKRDFPCIELELPEMADQDVTAAGFLPKGLMMASLKFPICQCLLEYGHDIVFSDIDAFWIKNPINYLVKNDHDFAFQNIYLFPKEVVDLWGFACCSGFFFVRCTKAGKDLIRSAQEFVLDICDDQAALNLALVNRKIEWEYGESEFVKSTLGNPVRVFLQATRSGYGLFRPVRGISKDRRLSVTALPQNMFRRHMFLELASDDIYVLHPNSPKSEKGKLNVFNELGYSIAKNLV